jgi:lipopolysaccharide transport system ATP-binding protein
MNGTILGMTRAEIKSKFDEIVEFAGVARYLDTPVKRYSSGMYVRLAFAVAAHLESEILIVDEVLAVGDAEFQKKCLGKMKDVSEKQGRTVLFVSHNMQAIANLSTMLITMHNGSIKNFANPLEGIEDFNSIINLNRDSNNKTGLLNEVESNDFIKIFRLYLTDENGINKSTFYNSERICLNLECEINKIDPLLVVGLGLYSSAGVNLFWSINLESAEPIQLRLGFQKIQMLIPSNILNHGKYSIELIVALHNSTWIYRPNDNAPVLYFSLIDQLPTNSVWLDKRQGCLAPNVEYKKIDNWEL